MTKEHSSQNTDQIFPAKFFEDVLAESAQNIRRCAIDGRVSKAPGKGQYYLESSLRQYVANLKEQLESARINRGSKVYH